MSPGAGLPGCIALDRSAARISSYPDDAFIGALEKWNLGATASLYRDAVASLRKEGVTVPASHAACT